LAAVTLYSLDNRDVVSQEAKWARYKANHSPPSSEETKNKWSYTSTPPIYHHSKQRDKLTYLYLFSYALFGWHHTVLANYVS
jgi:hypothetical protein